MAHNTAEFERLARIVYGEKWPYRLAADLGERIRSVRRWADGSREAPDALMERLGDLAAIVEDARLAPAIEQFIERYGSLVPINSLAAHLADAADRIRTAEPPRDRVRPSSKEPAV